MKEKYGRFQVRWNKQTEERSISGPQSEQNPK